MYERFYLQVKRRVKEDANRKSNIGHLLNGCYNLPVASGALAVIVLQ